MKAILCAIVLMASFSIASAIFEIEEEVMESPPLPMTPWKKKYWVDDGCQTEGNKKDKWGGGKDDYVGRYQDAETFRTGVRCCKTKKKGKVKCISPKRCPGRFTYEKAGQICAQKGFRLCTKDELLSEICCNTGGRCNHFPVWTSTPSLPPVTDDKYWVDDGCHTDGKKRKKNDKLKPKDDYKGQWQPADSFQAGVRCCNKPGKRKKCVSPVKCPAKYSFDKANEVCAKRGMVICSKQQILTEMCCGTGGNCNNYPVWTSTKYRESPEEEAKEKTVKKKQGKPFKIACRKGKEISIKSAYLMCKNSKKAKFQKQYTDKVKQVCHEKDSCKIGLKLSKKQKRKGKATDVFMNQHKCKKRKAWLHVKYRCQKEEHSGNEGQTVPLKCSADHMLHITESFLMCGNQKKSVGKMTKKVSKVCNGNQTCKVGYNKGNKKCGDCTNVNVDDPCPKQAKKLFVDYECEESVEEDPCDTNNGGCHDMANCVNNDGAAECACLAGFEGDGHHCKEVKDFNGYTKVDGKYCPRDMDIEMSSYGEMDDEEAAMFCSKRPMCGGYQYSPEFSDGKKPHFFTMEFDGTNCSDDEDWTVYVVNRPKYVLYQKKSCKNGKGKLHKSKYKKMTQDKAEKWCNKRDNCAGYKYSAQWKKGKKPIFFNSNFNGKNCKDNNKWDSWVRYNPCNYNNGGCSENADCQSEDGKKVMCECNPGYEGDGKVCTKPDPCDKNNGGCGGDAVCNSTGGKVQCACKPGFVKKDGVCSPKHPCDTGSHGCEFQCVKEGAMKKCVCPPKMELQDDMESCQWINQCDTNNGGCSSNALCQSSEGVASCSCNVGFEGDGKTCTRINPCLTSNGGCHAMASCTNDNGNAMCACDEGYEGDGKICTKINPCLTDNGGCSKHGACTNNDGMAECSCNDGFEGDGKTCTKINPCLKNNGGCHKDATCSNLDGEAQCECNDGFEGSGHNCTPIHPCDDGSHGCEHVCTKDEGEVMCECPALHELNADGKSCDLINPCESDNGGCDDNASCKNEAGVADCDCNEGFEGPGTYCSRIDPCLTENGGCSPHATCDSDAMGTVSCACKGGYEGNGVTCTKINPCLTNNGGCDSNASCANNDGTAVCTCNTGYDGTGILCQKINPCLKDNGGCDEHAICENADGTAECTCGPKYEGDGKICTMIDACKSDNGGCSAHASCVSIEAVSKCTCNEGWEGNGTECTRINPCLTNNGGCHADATCTNKDGTAECACKDGFEGPGKECTPIHACDDGSHGCEHVCTKEGAKAVCTCPEGKRLKADKKTCETIPPCDINHGGCHKDAKCTNNGDKAECKCEKPMVGDGVNKCESREQCMKAHKDYVVVKEGHYINGNQCGHKVPYDNHYKECDTEDSRYNLCISKGKGFENNDCLRYDPPIRNQEDCAREVIKLIKAGVCDPSGLFFGSFCNDSGNLRCTCQTAAGPFGLYMKSGLGNDIYQLKEAMERDPCVRDNGGCLPEAKCTNVKGKAQCWCPEGKVGDGHTHCESREQCVATNGPVPYVMIQADKYLSSPVYCGHQTPGDWKYGECTEDAGVYRLCYGYKYEKNLCALHDPPIEDNDDCAREVQKLVDAGICKANGIFSATLCSPQVKTQCFCERAGGPAAKWYNTTGKRDIYQLKKYYDPCEIDNGGCDDNASCDSGSGSVVCKCETGYEGDGKSCEKINPCDYDNGGCVSNASCENDDGVAICACNAGLVGDATKLCEPRAQCMDDPVFEVMMERKYISGGYCGDQTPGDRKYGECESTDSRYRICNSYSVEKDLCAKHDPPIRSQADCAREVQKLVDAGVCDPEGIFDSSLCSDDSKTSCVCLLPNAVRKFYTSTTSLKDMYQLKSGKVVSLERALAIQASMEAEEEIANALTEDVTSYTNILGGIFVSAMFIMGYSYGSHKMKSRYSPLLDAKTIEMQ